MRNLIGHVTMFRSLSIAAATDRKRSKALYVLIIVGLIGAGAAVVHEADRVIDADARVGQAVDVLHSAHRVLEALQDAETGQRGYLLTADEKYLLPYRRGVNSLGDEMVALTQAVGPDARSVKFVRRIAHVKNLKLEELARTTELARSGDAASAIAIVQSDAGAKYMDQLRADLGTLIDEWGARATAARSESDFRLRSGSLALIVFVALVCALMTYAYFIERRAFTRIHSSTETLNHEATHDTLTGLPNRRKFFQDLAALAATPGSASRQVALFYLDIDGFKSINDRFGHSAGDALLQDIAAGLRAVTRGQDTLARVGGDEFVLLAPDFATTTQLEQIAQRLIDRVEAVARNRHGAQCSVSASIGIATFPDPVTEMGMLADSADAAMYRAKQQGRRQYAFSQTPELPDANVLRFGRARRPG